MLPVEVVWRLNFHHLVFVLTWKRLFPGAFSFFLRLCFSLLKILSIATRTSSGEWCQQFSFGTLECESELH